MESNNRNVWIILAVVVVVLCCCMVAVVVAGAGFFTTQRYEWIGASSLQSERSEEAFAVRETPSLKIDNFAGSVIVRTGEGGLVRVAATRRARSQNDLDRIEVQVSERDGGLVIKTEKPVSMDSVSVDLEITVPVGTSLDALTGAGNVDIGGLTGEIDAYSGAGDIEVRGAAVCARLDTGAGSVRYQGTPQGECRFETGAGNVTLTLPSDLNVRVDLGTQVGDIDVDHTVEGQVNRQAVRGVIGSGDQGTIYAHTGAGNIDVVSR